MTSAAGTSAPSTSSAVRPADRPAVLSEPMLFVRVPARVPDERIVEALWECLRLRLRISRDNSDTKALATGYIEFESLDRAEKAYATVNGQTFPDHDNATLELRLKDNADAKDEPKPLARARLLKSLPLSITAGQLFDLCRPFGPVQSVALQLTKAHAGDAPAFKGQALVTFYSEDDAKSMASELHCTELEGQTIIVQLLDPKRLPQKSDAISRHARPLSPTQVSTSPSASRWALAEPFEPKTLTKGRDELNNATAKFDRLDSGEPRSVPQSRQRSDNSFDYAALRDNLNSLPEAFTAAEPKSEHDRLIQAVHKLEKEQFEDVVALIERLPKRERALCLFSSDYLRSKVSDALAVLNASDDDDDDSPAAKPAPASSSAAPTRSAGSNHASPAVPSGSELSTLASLAELPADMIMKFEPDFPDLDVQKVSAEERKEMDAFMDGLEGRPVHEVKQKLGERVFKVVKSLGLKGAPRITIYLLDNEPLRPLSHLIQYPIILRHKIALMPPSAGATSSKAA